MNKNSKQLKLTDLLHSATANENENNFGRSNSDNQIISREDERSPNNHVQSPSITTTDCVESPPCVQEPDLNTWPMDLSPIDSTERMMTAKSLRSIIFPISQFGMNNRSFRADWLDNIERFEYSVSRDAAFCFPCRAFDMRGSKENKFTVTGFTNWKKALEKKQGFYQHEASFHHINAMQSWVEKRERIERRTSVTELLSNVTLQKRRFCMKSIIQVILFLIENELAFRGDWDLEEHREMGVFRKLFEFKLKDSEELRDCQQIMPQNATYLSAEIQNELIAIIAKIVEEQIVNDINYADVPFFTILVDGTKDRKNKECVSLAARYVLNGVPTESLLGFETTKLLDAESNAEMILAKITTCGLHTSRILSQCYDGANVMSGDKGGIQRIVQTTLKRLIPYVHCFNHRLHLVVISAIDGVYLAASFFENIKLIYKFFHRTKVQSVYKGKSILKMIEIPRPNISEIIH